MKTKSTTKTDMIDELIDLVLENTFADLPYGRNYEPEQPELGIKDINLLRKSMIEVIERYVRNY